MTKLGPLCSLVLLFYGPLSTIAWNTSRKQQQQTSLHMNFLDDLGAALTGGKLIPQASLPYSPPLCTTSSISNQIRVLAVQERAITFTGEDFDVYDVTTSGSTPFATIRGAMLHLPGKDKMRLRTTASGQMAVELDRVLMAVTPTYDLYRSDTNVKLGWIEKTVISFTDTFDFYMEGNGGFGVTGLFKPPPAFRLEGDFIGRNFVMKNCNNEVVAKITKDGFIQFDAFNHYQVQVAAGMDAVFVIACLCAIDEEFDEQHKKTKEEREAKQNNGWF